MAAAARSARNDPLVIWEAQPGPQTALIACPIFEVFFGGARGGGKTDGVLGDFIEHGDSYGEHAIGLMLRRQRTELIETIERSRQIYAPLGWTYHEQDKMWRAPNGARLRFAYLERDSDAEAYQGHSYTRIYVEEIGNFPSPTPILRLMATLRSGSNVPVGFRATGNPGGPGHQWVRSRYIDPAPLGWKIIKDEQSGLDRVFIPSKVGDNKYLGEQYVQQLKASGNPQLVRAWLEGDWSVIEGAFFPEFSEALHVIPPFAIPETWLRFRSADWGSAKPFSVGWWAVVGDDFIQRANRNNGPSASKLPRGALVRYREWYGASSPNVGLKLPAEDVADGILAKELSEPRGLDGKNFINYGVLDPSAFASDGGPSIAERMFRRGVMFRKADNARVSQRGAMGGWDQLRARLIGDGERPMIYFFSTCTAIIRTLPALQHDPNKAEDVDTESEDHAPDECLIAGTMISTDGDRVPIEEMRLGRLVQTRKGLKRVKAVFSNGIRPVFSVVLSTGEKLTGTANHPVYVEGQGFVSLCNIRYGDMLRTCPIPINTAVEPGAYGQNTMAQSRRAITSTTSILTRLTTTSPISLASHIANIAASITNCVRALILNALNVMRHSSLWLPMLASARMPANPRGGEQQDWMMWNGLARNAVNYSMQVGSNLLNIAPSSVQVPEVTNAQLIPMSATNAANPSQQRISAQYGVRCVVESVTPAGSAEVFNLSVDEAEEYYASGVLTHNCRYACMSRPFVKEIPAAKVQKIISVGPLNNVSLDDLWENQPKPQRERV